MIVDVHTHAFPDGIAARAIAKLEPNSRCLAFSDGTVAGLRGMMKRIGVDRSVVASIATKQGQSAGILSWCRDLIRDGGRDLIPFASVHPEDDYAFALKEVRNAGLMGVKLHPFFQGFLPDEERMLPYFRQCRDLGLVVLIHAGHDIGFPPSDIASPDRLARLLKSVPGLTLIAAHLGGWMDWDGALAALTEVPVYIDTAYVRGYVPDSLARKFFEVFEGRLLFGSDSPWSDPEDDIRFVDRFARTPEERAAVLGGSWALLEKKTGIS